MRLPRIHRDYWPGAAILAAAIIVWICAAVFLPLSVRLYVQIPMGAVGGHGIGRMMAVPGRRLHKENIALLNRLHEDPFGLEPEPEPLPPPVSEKQMKKYRDDLMRLLRSGEP